MYVTVRTVSVRFAFYSSGIQSWHIQHCAGLRSERRRMIKVYADFLRKLAVLGAILVHFGLAASGLIGELPGAMRPDEPDFVERSAQIVANRDLNPRYFFYPGGPHIYANAGLFAASFSLSGSGLTFYEDFQQHRLYYYVLARLLSVACMSASVAVVFVLARLLLQSYYAALLSAWLVALSPLIVAYSAYARNDASTTFLAVLSVYFTTRLWLQPSRRTFCLSATLAGVAAGNRYFMAFLVGYASLALVAMGLMRKMPRQRLAIMVLAYVGISLAAFLASNPFLVAEYETALREARIQGRATHLGADGLSPIGNFLWYLSNSLPEGLTLPQSALAIVGFIYALVSRVPRLVWFSLLPLGYIAATSVMPLHWHRWVLQAMPFWSVLAGYATLRLFAVLKRSRHTSLKKLGVVIPAITLIWAGMQNAVYAAWRSAPSTREQAGAWMAAHLPAGSTVYQQGYGALVPDGVFELKGIHLRVPSVAEFIQKRADYVVLSSAIYGRAMAEPARYSAAVSSTLTFMREATLLRSFTPPRECHIELMVTLCGGPTLLIYQIPHPETQ